MSLHSHNPVEAVAAAMYSACLRDLPDITYRDRDWKKHREMMNAMSQEEKAAYYQRERESGRLEDHFVEKMRRPTPDDVHVTAMFPQMWGSTALGFGGLGGQAMTTAYTTVIECQSNGHYAVYFGSSGRLAYLVPSLRQDGSKFDLSLFFHDIAERSLASLDEAQRRYFVA